MRFLFVLFLSSASVFFLISNKWDVEKNLSTYDCNVARYPNGIMMGFMPCGGNPLVDPICANCHGQNPQTDAISNIISYENIVNAGTMNVFKILDGSTPVTEYIPGQEYTIELNMATLPVRKGFNVTLCSTSGDYGTFSVLPTDPDIQVANDVNGTVATHMVNTGVDVWRWKWTAPVATPGDITFNILTLKDNGLANGWDSLFVSAEVISPVLASLEEEEGSLSTISVWTDNNCLVLGGNVAAIEKIDLEMYSIGGQRVFQTNVLISDQAKVKLNGNLQTGVYIVHLKNRAGHTSLRKVYITSLY